MFTSIASLEDKIQISFVFMKHEFDTSDMTLWADCINNAYFVQYMEQFLVILNKYLFLVQCVFQINTIQKFPISLYQNQVTVSNGNSLVWSLNNSAGTHQNSEQMKQTK